MNVLFLAYRIVELLETDSDPAFLVQAAAAVGSFACGTEVGARAVLEAGAVRPLLQALKRDDPKVQCDGQH